MMKLLLQRGPDRGYFPEPIKFIFIAELPYKEEASKWWFEA